MNLPKLPWTKLLAEGALIIVSVYFAIVLEGMSQDREEKLAAHTALAQMLDEMREDQSDVGEIRAEQIERDRQYETLIKWLANPESLSPDMVGDAIDAIFFSNRTLYPRRSAWTTMIAAGQLSEIDDPALVTRLGNFYESFIVRVIDNGYDYDDNLNAIARTSASEIWDGVNRRLLTTDARQITVFRNQLRFMHLAWTLWYLDLLDEYGRTMDSLVLEIESYLEEKGFETGA
jgi:hypothetical protein